MKVRPLYQVWLQFLFKMTTLSHTTDASAADLRRSVIIRMKRFQLQLTFGPHTWTL
jgi:hypothetical protein